MMDHPALAIPNLLATYAMHFDDGDFEAAAALFDKGDVIVGGQHLSGRESILAMWQQWVRTYDGKPLTRHLVTNPIIAVDEGGTSATCQSQWTVLQAAPGFPLQIVASGRYRDSFARDDEGWHFATREYLQTDLVGDHSAHTIKPLSQRA
jgi:3-phenylpropionate/cinnamic acid dioxygenase small subunit